ncbi:MAG: hypothetical protein DME24_14675, partial [Verrucomicrobia bacterium]
RISPDTFTWENIFVPDWVLWPYSVLWRNRVEFTSVTFGNGMFVAVGSDVNLVSCLVYSPDGRNWKLAEDAFRGMYSVAYGDGVFVAVGVGQIASSTDGIHWRKRDPGKNFVSSSVTHGQNTFVCFDNGSQFMQSDLIASLMLSRHSPLELSIFGPVGRHFRLKPLKTSERPTVGKPSPVLFSPTAPRRGSIPVLPTTRSAFTAQHSNLE